MPYYRKFYPPAWDKMRDEALARAEYKCEFCGLLNGTEVVNTRKSHPLYPEGKPGRMWLQLAHKEQYQTWDAEAETMMLCPRCHRLYDRQYRRKGTEKQFTPVGLVVVWVRHKRARALALEAWSFDELLRVVASFAPGTEFELQSEMLMRVAGHGRYRREECGITVLREQGVCLTFGRFLQDVFTGAAG